MQSIDTPVAFDSPPEPEGIEYVHVGQKAVLDIAVHVAMYQDPLNWQDAINEGFDALCRRAGDRFARANDVALDEVDGFAHALCWRVA